MLDPTNLLTIANFASVPMGIAIVWIVMSVLANIIPNLSTQAKSGIQALVALVWVALAVTLFLSGDIQSRLQQGVVSFFLVAGTQYWGYQLKSKLVDDPKQAVAAYIPYPDQGSPEGRT